MDQTKQTENKIPSNKIIRHDMKGRLSIVTLTCGLLKLKYSENQQINECLERMKALVYQTNDLITLLLPDPPQKL